jgi:hypothetical protein
MTSATGSRLLTPIHAASVQLKGVFALMAKDFHRTDEGLLQARVQRKLTTPTLRGDDASRVCEQRAE